MGELDLELALSNEDEGEEEELVAPMLSLCPAAAPAVGEPGEEEDLDLSPEFSTDR
jgi:hypothetical protein